MKGSGNWGRGTGGRDESCVSCAFSHKTHHTVQHALVVPTYCASVCIVFVLAISLSCFHFVAVHEQHTCSLLSFYIYLAAAFFHSLIAFSSTWTLLFTPSLVAPCASARVCVFMLCFCLSMLLNIIWLRATGTFSYARCNVCHVTAPLRRTALGIPAYAWGVLKITGWFYFFYGKLRMAVLSKRAFVWRSAIFVCHSSLHYCAEMLDWNGRSSDGCEWWQWGAKRKNDAHNRHTPAYLHSDQMNVTLKENTNVTGDKANESEKVLAQERQYILLDVLCVVIAVMVYFMSFRIRYVI